MFKGFLSQSSILAVVGVLAVGVAAVGLDGSPKAADHAKSWGFDTANLDRTCKPCDDFYQFAMGGWMKANPIPPEYSIWGSFSQLADRNQKNLREILEAA
ncbi:MAG TPA: M13 family metallopeptidase N-terminal domain-containing protein, partial [Candidatus Acidoferrum sp.]